MSIEESLKRYWSLDVEWQDGQLREWCALKIQTNHFSLMLAVNFDFKPPTPTKSRLQGHSSFHFLNKKGTTGVIWLMASFLLHTCLSTEVHIKGPSDDSSQSTAVSTFVQTCYFGDLNFTNTEVWLNAILENLLQPLRSCCSVTVFRTCLCDWQITPENVPGIPFWLGSVKIAKASFVLSLSTKIRLVEDSA